MKPMHTRGFELADWQQEAVDAWVTGDGRPFHGTLEIFTGGGKTLLALTAIARVSEAHPDLRVAIVVPTEALARQWITSLTKYTDVDPADIGLLGAGRKDSLHTRRVLVAVLNSAAKQLPAMARDVQPLMLVVDECHRAGAPTFSAVLRTPSPFRLGLSATPEREEVDEHGEPLQFDEQVVGREIGAVVAHFNLKDARRVGWLPDYDISHHGLTLLPEERREYESISRRIDELGDELKQQGVDTTRAMAMRGRQGDLGELIRAYVGLTTKRKDLLYRADERTRVAARLVVDAMSTADRRILLFHERVDQAAALRDQVQAALPEVRVALEHSRLPDRERTEAIAAFRSGEAPILVSVKSLIEGIDVPEADVGVSVASSASVRQRIQALGRVLRRTFDQDDAAGPKHADMHVLYVADTVDELIYAKEDWSDLTGEGANHYWRWSLDPEVGPERQEGPPASPRPTEEQEWQRLGEQVPEQPTKWLGVLSGQEYSVDTLGNVKNEWGTTIANPQGVDRMVQGVRGRPGGRFRVTPEHQLVLVSRESDGGVEFLVAGGLGERFRAVDVDESPPDDGRVDVARLVAGDPYPGPANADGGEYYLRMKRGGVIERRSKAGAEFALVEGSPWPDREQNAKALLAAWREAVGRGITFSVNDQGHAWFEAGGQRRFLANVAGGFAWPTDSIEEDQSE